jgi:hypothetical protein
MKIYRQIWKSWRVSDIGIWELVCLNDLPRCWTKRILYSPGPKAISERMVHEQVSACIRSKLR